MTQQRRMTMFLVLSFGATFLWLKIGLPYFYPEMLKTQAERQAAALKQAAEDELHTGSGLAATDPKSAGSSNQSNETAPENTTELQELPKYPNRQITLGSLKGDGSIFMQLELTSRGAAVSGLQLNDPRYRELENRSLPLSLLGAVPESSLLSFDMQVAAVDRLLIQENTSLDRVNWQVDDSTLTDREVTFRYPSPDGSVELFKKYSIREGDPKQRDEDSNGYSLDVTVGFKNLTKQPVSLKYKLQGPVGFPLEDPENTRRFRMLQAGFLNSGSIRHEQITAQEIVKRARSQHGIDSLRSPVRFIGLDGQHFATLLVPKANQEKERWIEEVQPQLLQKSSVEAASQISLTLESNLFVLEPEKTIEHQYTLFAGPKRTALLAPIDADGIIEYGWFSVIGKMLLSLLNIFHNWLYLPYGLAIIMLTVVVRGAMYPISRKHALVAKKMKEMQPRIEEIRKKYEHDKEKLAKAQMELMKESGFFSGCLPMLLQLPIFIALYQALTVSVDLRMAEFLWIDNLAAPDRLFRLPFTVPFMGWNDFNLLPIITVGLFIVQQKLFAPPPTSDEMRLQQKMMSYMMIFIGAMFYTVPAGLCVYFIASSLWAIAERKILDFHDVASDKAKSKPDSADQAGKNKSEEPPEKPSWFKNVMSALDEAANPAGNGKSQPAKGLANKNQSGKGNNKKKHRT